MNKSQIYQHIYILYAMMFFLYICNFFLAFTLLGYFLGISAIFLFIIAFFRATTIFKTLGILFTVVGSILYMTTEVTFAELLLVLTDNYGLLTLFMMLSWMNSIVRSGGYDFLLSKIMKGNARDMGTLYNRSSISTFSLGTFLNLPAITISQDIMKANLKSSSKQFRNRFINLASVRSYTMALLWSPLEIVVAVGVFVTGVRYIEVLPWLLTIVVIIFILDNLIGKIRFKKYDYAESASKTFTRKDRKKLGGLLLALALFLIAIILAGNIEKLDFIMTITLLIFPFTLVWAMILKRLKRFSVVGWHAWKNGVNSMHNFIVLFISLAFFSNGISKSVISTYIYEFILYFANTPLLLMFMIQLFILIMSLFGVHAIASIGILSGLMVPLLEIIDPVSLAIVIIIGSVSTFAVSTYGVLVTITSVNTTQNPYRITLDNLIFTIVLGTIGTLLAYSLMIIG